MKIHNLETDEWGETEDVEMLDVEELNRLSKQYASFVTWMELHGHFYGFRKAKLILDISYT